MIVSELPETQEDTSALAQAGGDTSKMKKLFQNQKTRKKGLLPTGHTVHTCAAKVSNDTIIQAYYNVGFVYVEGLNDYEHAIDAFQTLNNRYPENKFTLPSYYELI